MIVVDNWYAEAIAHGVNQGVACGTPTPGVVSFDELLARSFPASLLRLARIKAVRGALLFLAAKHAERIICTFSSRGVTMLLLLETLFGPKTKRLFFVEYLRPEPSGGQARFKEAVHVLVYGFLFRHALAGIQVMTRWEVDAYARRFNMPSKLFHFIPFPMMISPGQVPPLAPSAEPVVMASGRAACDWPTVFAAAQGAGWRLLVVCARSDRPLVDALNADGRATVLSEISAAEHQRLLQSSTVYALVLHEIYASSGQVRFARTIESGVPVVASAVKGLDGYLQDGVTGAAVPVGDAAALRRRLDALVADSTTREALRRSAYEAMRPRTLTQFVASIKKFALPERASLG